MIDLTQTPKRLKQSILMEAMQGKLTKQLPSDGNASDLLVKIVNYKRDLVQSGRLKGYSKPLPPVKEDEEPFNIPDNWQWIRLSEIGSWKSGSTPKRSNKFYYHGNIPWLKVGDLNNSYITHAEEHISNKALNNSSMRVNPKGSILVAMYAGEDIDKLGILKVAATTNQAICDCIPYLINNKFLFYYLMSQRSEFMSLGTGGAQSNISRTKIIHYPISIPPLAEQKRIVQRLDQILPKIDNLNKDVVRLHSIRKAFPHRLKQSLLMEAMQGKLTKQLPSDGSAEELLQKIQQKKQALIKAGKIRRHKTLPPISKDEIPFKIPKNWKWVRLGNIACYIQQGKTPKYGKSNLPIISQKCVRWNGIDMTPAKTIVKSSLKDYKKERFLRTGDILWNSRGAGTVGRASLVSFNIVKRYNNKLVTDGNVFVVRLLNVLSQFMFLYIKSNIVNEYLKKIISGSTNQKQLNKSNITCLLVPIPPLAEQKRIVKKLNKLFSEV